MLRRTFLKLIPSPLLLWFWPITEVKAVTRQSKVYGIIDPEAAGLHIHCGGYSYGDGDGYGCGSSFSSNGHGNGDDFLSDRGDGLEHGDGKGDSSWQPWTWGGPYEGTWPWIHWSE